MNLLILGGTAESRELARLLAPLHGLNAVVSLSGATQTPAKQDIPVRVGGFGGVAGLCSYLKDKNIDALVDATHPFAAGISLNAKQAASQAGLPLLRVNRPKWVPEGPENWISVSSLPQAVAALPSGARAFTATGRGSLDEFASRSDIYTCLRVIDDPQNAFPGNGEFVVARPPFSVEAEEAELKRTNASHLVVKNAGGVAARTKLTAAGNLGLPIIIVTRPPVAQGVEMVEDVQSAYDWIVQQLNAG